jgi:hypothetical protein
MCEEHNTQDVGRGETGEKNRNLIHNGKRRGNGCEKKQTIGTRGQQKQRKQGKERTGRVGLTKDGYI